MLGPAWAATLGANGPRSWIWWSWVRMHLGVVAHATRQHIELTAIAVGLGLVISFPIALLAWRWHRLRGPAFAITGGLYTIPSLALFALLIPFTGLSTTTVEVGLVSYTLLILVRNILIGLDAVPAEVREAAQGMGYGPARQLLRVELPLAVPAIVAGVRVATVTTVGLVTIAALLGQGGLGTLIYDGLERDFRTPLVIGTVLSVALAAAADLGLLGVQWLITPWSRRRG